VKLECYELGESQPEIVPGKRTREWMDQTAEGHPYRCLPLTMANATGWELLCPADIDISWNGGNSTDDIVISSPDDTVNVSAIATSHFAYGIVTFHPGYLFRTPPGWHLWVGGAPNFFVKGMEPLTGIVETDWSPFPFTMNWKLNSTEPLRFKKGDAFCFIKPVPQKQYEEFQPVRLSLNDNEELLRDYHSWHESRTKFNAGVDAEDEVGVTVTGERTDNHQSKRRLKPVKHLNK